MLENRLLNYQPLKSRELDQRLKQVVSKKQRIEQEYREREQKFWTIMFIDASASAKKVYELGENVSNAVFANYQTMVRDTLKMYSACFIEPGGGPQVVACFEDPSCAIDAADAVIHCFHQWNEEQDEVLQILPAIGVHQGYINYHDGLIHQSNTNNMAKRIQCEAQPGQIFVSPDLCEELNHNSRFQLNYVRTAILKNIPEPQELFEAVVVHRNQNPANGSASVRSTRSRRRNLPKNVQEKHDWIFVYIDVCGSTKKFWSYGDREASELIKRYQTICHQSFTSYQCAYVKSCEGDQIVACYEKRNADGAISAAIQILQTLFRRNINLPQHKQVHAAIGIHLGEVILQGENPVTTADMRVGKGIQSQAESDEILVSQEFSRMLSPDLHTHLNKYGWQEFPGLPDTYLLHSFQWFRVTPRPIRPNPRQRR